MEQLSSGFFAFQEGVVFAGLALVVYKPITGWRLFCNIVQHFGFFNLKRITTPLTKRELPNFFRILLSPGVMLRDA